MPTAERIIQVPKIVEISEENSNENVLYGRPMVDKMISESLRDLYVMMDDSEESSSTSEGTVTTNFVSDESYLSEFGETGSGDQRIESLVHQLEVREHEFTMIKDENQRLIERQLIMEKELREQNRLIARLISDLEKVTNDELASAELFVKAQMKESSRRDRHLQERKSEKELNLRERLRSLSKKSLIPC
jgi:hypothetical protein